MPKLIINGDINVTGGGTVLNGCEIVSLNSYVAKNSVYTWGRGRITFNLSDGKYLRFEFGEAWINDGVEFRDEYDTIIWANATHDTTSDHSLALGRITSITTTGLTFQGTQGSMMRWEVWGILSKIDT